MKKILLTAAFVGVLGLSAFAQFDPANPDIKKLPADQLPVWIAKGIGDWKAAFGDVVGDWNPLQMEFYKAIRLKALDDAQKKQMIAMSDAEWEYKLGGSMDTWQVEDMLFYSAIQDLANQ